MADRDCTNCTKGLEFLQIIEESQDIAYSIATRKLAIAGLFSKIPDATVKGELGNDYKKGLNILNIMQDGYKEISFRVNEILTNNGLMPWDVITRDGEEESLEDSEEPDYIICDNGNGLSDFFPDPIMDTEQTNQQEIFNIDELFDEEDAERTSTLDLITENEELKKFKGKIIEAAKMGCSSLGIEVLRILASEKV